MSAGKQPVAHSNENENTVAVEKGLVTSGLVFPRNLVRPPF